ncbi:TetR/AcrR family transcriptional regulator [Catenulispora sp. NF23]|uniref:TetR/AcrR family transcriptional regulator n=1 Tax=Catenulispora pinistramenti TaxID=2705254 RepID=A0ABS5KSM4_9ACTN|nr:TetR/AcrR family transcriptional regulator [Catenulispora pinistramenti]MBS2534637.1 TetR/AcrR family transcriptional regulator [Catenulispora pinistramenti]MBS2549048.1 TetR/AcrR family transcriptional regulator [Catenulispora pinistramenti]
MASDSTKAGGRGSLAADRRTELLDRLAEVIAENGIEGVSIRTLASRADVSIGTVQYYFATKDELLRAVWLHVREQAARDFLSTDFTELAPIDRLDRLVGLLVAPEADDRLARVWLALVARAAHDPAIAALHRGQWLETEGVLARALAAANPARAAEPGDEVVDAAAELLALLDGLTIAVLTEPERMPAARAIRIARAWTGAWCAEYQP